MKLKYFPYSISILLASCSLSHQDATPLKVKAQIYPDYSEVTMPCNIASPTFALCDSISNLSDLQAVFRSGETETVVGCDDENGFCISPDDWHTLTAKAGAISVTIQGYDGSKWVEYDPFSITISADTIDKYLTYSLIEPGYEVWNEMGIYQRNLETSDEEALPFPIVRLSIMASRGKVHCLFAKRHKADVPYHRYQPYRGIRFPLGCYRI